MTSYFLAKPKKVVIFATGSTKMLERRMHE